MLFHAAALTAACKSDRGAPAGAPRDGGGVRGKEDAATVVRAAEPAAAPLPALPADELAALRGTVLAAAGREDGFRVVAFTPSRPGPGVTLTPPGGSWYPAPTAWPLAIHTVDVGDTHTEQLARLGAGPDDAVLFGPATARVRAPTASADGKVLIAETDLDSFRDLYRIDPATGAATRLTRSPQGNFEPSLSPDGARLAFVSSRDGDSEIYVRDLAGDGDAELRVTAVPRDDWAPAWSPDGAWLAFLSDRDGSPRVYLVRPDATDLRLAHADAAAGEEQPPVWSPDGARLAYAVSTRDGASEIWVVDVAAATAARVSAPGARDEAPAWSPDGRHLVFVSTRDRRIDLWIARADGTAASRLTETPEEEWIPRWLP